MKENRKIFRGLISCGAIGCDPAALPSQLPAAGTEYHVKNGFYPILVMYLVKIDRVDIA